ncbi:MAG TPA: hypothetical protein VN025_05905 [Candidatus Dormibacteraeota bacterium]|jgi:hypothetical protein|nr:hypothetical protein [Candidatus Dormibacteraeota bacterium]
MNKPEKPPIVRPQTGNTPVGNNEQIKKSILADVDRMRIDQGKKSGGV